MFFQWVARSNGSDQPFQNFEVARYSWLRLKAVFPEMLSAILMPNHLHLILPKKSEQVLFRISGWLGGISRKTSQKNLWERIPDPREVSDSIHLKRLLRYVALNPCRKNLTPDPLQWYWSTYREVLGATPEEGDLLQRTAAAIKFRVSDFKERFYEYVSSDESVRVHYLIPQSVPVPDFAVFPIESIRLASTSALRVPPDAIKQPGEARTLFVQLARRHRWKQTSLIANMCGASERTIQRIAQTPVPRSLSAAELCLGDSRLQKHGWG